MGHTHIVDYFDVLPAHRTACFVLARRRPTRNNIRVIVNRRHQAGRGAIDRITWLTRLDMDVSTKFTSCHRIIPRFQHGLTNAIRVGQRVARVTIISTGSLYPRYGNALRFLFVASFNRRARLRAINSNNGLTVLFIVRC